MCNNSKRKAFLIQFMIMTAYLTMVWNAWKDVGGKCDAQSLWDCWIEDNSFHRTKYQSFGKKEL